MNDTRFPQASERPQTFGGLRIKRLVVMRTGTYNPMYYRPYETHFNADVAEKLSRRIHDNGPGMTTSSLMSGIANQIVYPSRQHMGAVAIPNDWTTPRGRFSMVVESITNTGTPTFWHIQGYTSHFDQSHGGYNDPDIIFFINSYSRVSRGFATTATGIVTRDTVTESAQVINGRMVKSQTQQDLYGMRPMDIYGMMQTAQMQSVVPGDYMTSSIVDNRHTLSHQAVTSSRSNNLPANLLSKMVDSWQTGSSLLDFGQGTDNQLSRTRGYVYEGTLLENEFFARLSSFTGVQESTAFKMSHLKMLDPNVDNPQVSTFITLSQNAMRMVHQAGSTATWHNPGDIGAWVASVLVSAVPTIMMEFMIGEIAFRATNKWTVGGQTAMTFENIKDISGQDLAPVMKAFEQRFTHEVMYDLTHGNQETYELVISVNLLGDTVIDIAFGSNPMARYVCPSFCDSLMSPIITPQVGVLHNAVSDFGNILNSVNVALKGTGMAVNQSV